MRKLIYILLTLSIFYGCQEDKDVGFDISISQENISFQPTAGGGIIAYPQIRTFYPSGFGIKMRLVKKYYEQAVMPVIPCSWSDSMRLNKM